MDAPLIHNYSSLLAWLLLLLIWPITGCHNADRRNGVSLSLTVPLLTFIQATPAESGVSNAIVDFPTLEVFDSAGQLVYRSHEAVKNVELVKSLPGALAGLTVLPNQPKLRQVVANLPGLAEADQEALLQSLKPTVIAYSLEDCRACSSHEEALKPDTVSNLVAHGLNSLMIRVSRPGPDGG